MKKNLKININHINTRKNTWYNYVLDKCAKSEN